nr:zinc-type alcohol dehydrogenase-like protein [Quercus suber]
MELLFDRRTPIQFQLLSSAAESEYSELLRRRLGLIRRGERGEYSGRLLGLHYSSRSGTARLGKVCDSDDPLQSIKSINRLVWKTSVRRGSRDRLDRAELLPDYEKVWDLFLTTAVRSNPRVSTSSEGLPKLRKGYGTRREGVERRGSHQVKSANQLELVDLGLPLPQPGPSQALVRVHAASFNYRDKLVVSHSDDYPVKAALGLVPCSDGAGIVEAVGTKSRWKVGDRVILHFTTWLHGNDSRNLDMTKIAGGGSTDGTLQRYVVWDDDRLVPVPAKLSMEEASTFMTAGLTATLAFDPGMTVLTQGTGGLAAAAGATVIGLSSSTDKEAALRDMGAKHTINYRSTPDWSSEVLAMTGGLGVDLVVDVVGAESIKQSLRALRHGGHIVVIGNLSKDPSLAVDIMHDILYGAKTSQQFSSHETTSILTGPRHPSGCRTSVRVRGRTSSSGDGDKRWLFQARQIRDKGITNKTQPLFHTSELLEVDGSIRLNILKWATSALVLPQIVQKEAIWLCIPRTLQRPKVKFRGGSTSASRTRGRVHI